MRTYYASQYAILDSDVLSGGGTDDTASLQALLDKAKTEGGIRLVMDGAALVHGLKLHSNTTIECLGANCGFYLQDHANRPILTNAEWNLKDSRPTQNIRLLGGTYNHNCAHQEHDLPTSEYPMPETRNDDNLDPSFRDHHYIYLMEFYGVENFLMRDVILRNQRTYAFTLGNFKNAVIENCVIDMAELLTPGNQDGLHFFGPGQFLTIRNFRGLTGDDIINIAPDEIDGVSDITDVLVDGVFFDHAYQGIRMLSHGTGRLDRVSIRNVTGTYRVFGVSIMPFIDSTTFGNYGDISLENIDLRQDNGGTMPTTLLQVGGSIECFSMKNIRFHCTEPAHSCFDLGTTFYAGFYNFKDDRRPTIRTLIVDGLVIMDDAPQSPPVDWIYLLFNFDHLILRNIELHRAEGTASAGNLIRLIAEAKVRRLVLDGVYAEKIANVIQASAGYEIGFLQARNVTLNHGGQVLDLQDADIGQIFEEDVKYIR